jgi:hypothetical protein
MEAKPERITRNPSSSLLVVSLPHNMRPAPPRHRTGEADARTNSITGEIACLGASSGPLLRARSEAQRVPAAVGFVFTTFSFSVIGGLGLGLAWVQIGREGLSGLTYRGRRLVPWQEARFVEWIPSGGRPPGGGWTRPALAAYRERPFGRSSGRDERLIFVRLRFIVARRQEFRVARQLLEACRRFGSSTSVEHRPGYGLVQKAMWEEIEK